MSVDTPTSTPVTGGRSLGRTVALTTVALAAGRVVALLAGIVALALASRYLGLHDFGALSAGMAYASLFAVLTDLGLSTVATREISLHPAHERRVLGLVLGVGLALAVGCVGLGLASMTLIYSGDANTATRQAIVILLSQVLVAPLTGAARAFFTARQRGYLIAVGEITLAVGMALFAAIAVAAQLGYRAVVVAFAGGYVAQAVVMAALALLGGARARPRYGGAARLMAMALPLGGTLVLNYVYFRLDILLLSWLKTDVAVARYGLAYRVLEGLMVLPSYVMLGLFPAIARQAGDRQRLAATVGAALAAMEAAALPLAALMAIFSRQVVVVLGGQKYAAAAPVLALLALALALSYISGVFGWALMALGRQRAMLWLTLGPLTVNLAANLLLIPPLGVIGAAIAVVLSELAGLALVGSYYARLAGRPLWPAHGRILTAGLVLGAVAVARFELRPGGGPLLVALVGGVIGAVLYAGALLALGAIPGAVVDQLPLPSRLLKHLPRR